MIEIAFVDLSALQHPNIKNKHRELKADPTHGVLIFRLLPTIGVSYKGRRNCDSNMTLQALTR